MSGLTPDQLTLKLPQSPLTYDLRHRGDTHAFNKYTSNFRPKQ